jgi:hypothetical protein
MLRYSSASPRFLERRFGIGLVARLVAQLGHDVGIFRLDHRRRHVEVMIGCQLVEQPPLHVRPGQPVQLLLLLVAQQPLQLLKVVEAELLGEVIIDLGFAGGLHCRDLDVERRRLALQILGLVVAREGHVELLLVADLEAEPSALRSRESAGRAEHDRHAFAGAALECDAVAMPTKSITSWSPLAALCPFLASS